MILSNKSLSYIKSKLQNNSQLVHLERLTLSAITWNVGSKLEDSSNLKDLLYIPLGNLTLGLPDLILVGLQEIIELSATNVISTEFTGNSAERVTKWCDAILSNLNTTDNIDHGIQYSCIASHYMVGLWIGIFSKESITPIIKNIQVASLPRGAGGLLGNKGAVYVRCDILDTSICFINNHFNAHRQKVSKRNEDYEAIISTPVFYDELLGKPVHLPTHKPFGIDLNISTPTVIHIRQQQKDIRHRLHSLQQKIQQGDRIREEKIHKSMPMHVDVPNLPPVSLLRGPNHNHDDSSGNGNSDSTTQSSIGIGQSVSSSSSSSPPPSLSTTTTTNEMIDSLKSDHNISNNSTTNLQDYDSDDDNISPTSGGISESTPLQIQPSTSGISRSDGNSSGSTTTVDTKTTPPKMPISQPGIHFKSQSQPFHGTSNNNSDNNNNTSNNNSNSGSSNTNSNNTDNNTKLRSIVEEQYMFSADDHDIIIFVGDLNYRLSNHLNIDQVYDTIYNRSFLDLVPYDQLIQEKDNNYEILHEFTEGELQFLPTYKYIPGTNSYDQRPDKKMRIPAWCDRVLWRVGKYKHREAMRNKLLRDIGLLTPTSISSPNANILPIYTHNTPSNIIRNENVIGIEYEKFERVELLVYQSCPQFIISDHKPVRALLSLNIKKVNSTEKESILKECCAYLRNQPDSMLSVRLPSSSPSSS